jgi:hypothetical protein
MPSLKQGFLMLMFLMVKNQVSTNLFYPRVTEEGQTQNAEEFTRAIHQLKCIWLRDGAIRWGVFQDITDASRFVETFVVESWLEHLRQHERFTKSAQLRGSLRDRLIQQQVRAFHQGEDTPLTSHMIYAKLSS